MARGRRPAQNDDAQVETFPKFDLMPAAEERVEHDQRGRLEREGLGVIKTQRRVKLWQFMVELCFGSDWLRTVSSLISKTDERAAGTHSLGMLERDSALCRRLARDDSGASAPVTVAPDLVLTLDSECAARLVSREAERSTAAAGGECAGSAAAPPPGAPGGGTAAVAKGDATRASGDAASTACSSPAACDLPREACVTGAQAVMQQAVRQPRSGMLVAKYRWMMARRMAGNHSAALPVGSLCGWNLAELYGSPGAPCSRACTHAAGPHLRLALSRCCTHEWRLHRRLHGSGAASGGALPHVSSVPLRLAPQRHHDGIKLRPASLSDS